LNNHNRDDAFPSLLSFLKHQQMKRDSPHPLSLLTIETAWDLFNDTSRDKNNRHEEENQGQTKSEHFEE
jgi:hypothetical protein